MSEALAQPLPALAAPAAGRADWWTIAVLVKRDLKRLVRQRTRLAGAVGQPLIFWLVIGSGMAGTFRVPGSEHVGYMEYFYPGVICMVVLFTSIFSTMSVIEDRNAGFLQSVLTAPGGRGAVALGKIGGGTAVALIQAALFLVMAPLAGFPFLQVHWLSLAAVLLLSSIGLTAVGFALAWVVDSTQGYHAVMSILLIPLWVLSGAMFPATGAKGWLSVIMMLNPMTYCVQGARRALYGGTLPASLGVGGVSGAVELAVMAVFAVATVALSVAVVRKRA